MAMSPSSSKVVRRFLRLIFIHPLAMTSLSLAVKAGDHILLDHCLQESRTQKEELSHHLCSSNDNRRLFCLKRHAAVTFLVINKDLHTCQNSLLSQMCSTDAVVPKVLCFLDGKLWKGRDAGAACKHLRLFMFDDRTGRSNVQLYTFNNILNRSCCFLQFF